MLRTENRLNNYYYDYAVENLLCKRTVNLVLQYVYLHMCIQIVPYYSRRVLASTYAYQLEYAYTFSCTLVLLIDTSQLTSIKAQLYLRAQLVLLQYYFHTHLYSIIYAYYQPRVCIGIIVLQSTMHTSQSSLASSRAYHYQLEYQSSTSQQQYAYQAQLVLQAHTTLESMHTTVVVLVVR